MYDFLLYPLCMLKKPPKKIATPQDRARKAMFDNRWEQKDLAAKCGADPTALSRWLTGNRRGFSLPVAKKLAALIGAEIGELHHDGRAA